MSHPAGSVLLNRPSLLCVLVVESGITAARCGTRPAGTVLTRRTSMFARLGQSQPAQGADVIARAMAALALAALAVIHVGGPPATPAPERLGGRATFGSIPPAGLARSAL